MRWLARLASGLVLAVILAAVVAAATERMAFAAFRKSAADIQPPAAFTIDRDGFGVPIITGETDAAASFGLALAHAEDDFATIQRQLLGVRGRLGAVDGRNGARVDFLSGLLDVRGQVERGMADVPQETLDVARAYADGLNLFAANNPDAVLYRPLFPVNENDVVGGFVLVAPLFFGLDRVIGDIHGEADLPRALGAEERGSNGFAFAPSRTADGSTVLVSNSHQPWHGPAAWYEATVESREGDGFRMVGALFPGSPVVLMGHNDFVAYTNTVNRPDLIDIYELELNEAGHAYRYDGQWRALERRVEWLRVKVGPVRLPIRQVFWRSVHGPVLKTGQGTFAIRYAGDGETRQLTQWQQLNRARDLDGFLDVMRLRAIPAINYVYADRSGNIVLLYNARLPERDPSVNWGVVLPGDDPALVWDADAPFERLPLLVNPPSGYLVNANNTPFVASSPRDDLRPEDYADTVGIETRMTNRIRRAVSLIEADSSLTMAEIEAIKFDTGYDPESRIGRAVRSAMDADGPDAEILQQWDWTLDGVGPADALASLIVSRANRAVRLSEPMPQGEELLAEAYADLIVQFGRPDPALAEVQRLVRGDVDLPVFGGADALRNIGTEAGDGGRRIADFGDSFLMIVRFPPDGGPPTSRRINPFGASQDPNSPHFSDQAELFAAHRFRPSSKEQSE